MKKHLIVFWNELKNNYIFYAIVNLLIYSLLREAIYLITERYFFDIFNQEVAIITIVMVLIGIYQLAPKIKKKKIFLKTVIFLLLLIVFKIILNCFKLEFMNWVYYLAFFATLITWTLGCFQHTYLINRKWVRIVLNGLISIITIVVLGVGQFIYSWRSRDARIIKVDNIKVVEESYMIWDLQMEEYFRYYNIFIKGNERIYLSDIKKN